MDIFSNDDLFASDMMENSWAEGCDHGYESVINTDEQPLAESAYFQDNAYEPLLGHELCNENNSYEQSLSNESYLSDHYNEHPLTLDSIDYTVSGLDHTFTDDQIGSTFTTRLKGIENIADKQIGETCGLESVENIVQLYNPELGDDFSGDIQKEHQDYFNKGGSLKVEYYDDILKSQGITSTWNEFNHQQIAEALSEHRPVVVVVDANDIDPLYAEKGDNAWHAITLTGVDHDSDGNILGYRGIDSNFPGQEKYWSAGVLEKASKEWRDEVLASSQEDQITQQVLIPDQQALAWGSFSQGEQIA